MESRLYKPGTFENTTDILLNGKPIGTRPQGNVIYSLQVLILDIRRKKCKLVEFYHLHQNKINFKHEGIEDIRNRLLTIPLNTLVAVVTNTNYYPALLLEKSIKTLLGIPGRHKYMKLYASVSIIGHPQRTRLAIRKSGKVELKLYHIECLGKFK